MRQRKRGLTFLELLVAMSIAFLSISFLLGLFASATSSSGRARQLSVANFLKQSTMERILAMPLDQLAATSSSYSGQFSEYTYEVDVINPGDFDGDGVPDPELRVLEVTITGPSGFKTKVQTLRKAYDPYYGVAAWQNGKKALVSLADQTGPCLWNHPTGQMFTSPPQMPGGRPGDMAANKTMTKLWAVDTNAQGLRPLDISDPLANWGDARKPGGVVEITGIAADEQLQNIFVADAAGNQLWKFEVATQNWTKCAAASLNHPKGVAVTADGSEVWVADTENRGIRRYHPASDTWDPTLYQDPGMKRPEGIAVYPDGSEVVAITSKRIHYFVPSSSAWQTSEPADGKIQSDYPCGMIAVDDGTDIVVWLSTKAGSFWRIIPHSSSEECFWPGYGYN